MVTLQSDSAHFQNQTDHCNSASCPVLSCTVYTILSCPVLSCICPVLFYNVVCSCIFEWWQSAYGENERIILSDFHQELTFRGGPVRIIPWIGRYPVRRNSNTDCHLSSVPSCGGFATAKSADKQTPAWWETDSCQSCLPSNHNWAPYPVVTAPALTTASVQLGWTADVNDQSTVHCMCAHR